MISARGRRAVASALVAALTWAGTACREPGAAREADSHTLVFVHQPLGPDHAALRALLDGFERAHPGVRVRTELIPNSSDVAHQYFLTSLAGGSAAFDVLVVDVIWVSEFARAGWIADLSDTFPPELLAREFLEGPAQAVLVDGRVQAVPWYVDVGLLYYRTDLVPRAPRTFAELERFVAAALAKDPTLAGYTWQGRQYEGLVCNVFEAMWGHGAPVQSGARVVVDTPEARAGLGYLRRLIETGISPPSVTSAAEEESRRLFQAGRAVMMRNWPYAWEEAQREGSPIRGKVGIAPLPTLTGDPGFGTLGGWQLAVNANVSRQRQRLAAELIRHLTSAEATLQLALAYGRNPPRREVYVSPEVRARAPSIAALLPMFERARPRPVTPYYALMSDALQSEFSAVIVGVRTPAQALERLQAQLDRIAGVAQ